MATDMIARALAAKAMQEAASASEKEPLVVTFTVTDPDTLSLTADKTFAEVDAAYKQKRPIHANVSIDRDLLWFFNCAFADAGYIFNTFEAMNSSFFLLVYTETASALLVARTILTGFARIPGDGPFDANEFIIRNVGEPEHANDAATKGYADKILTAGNNDSVIIKSSTPNSTKKFRITVDDAGAITATEVV